MTIGLATSFLSVPRDRLFLEKKPNNRIVAGDLKGLGKSLDKDGQKVPLVATRLSDHEDHFAIYDGERRIISVDRGFAGSFRKTNEYSILLLSTPEGRVPDSASVLRYCANLPFVRKTWTVLDEARYYQTEIDLALASQLAEENRKRKDKGIPALGSLGAKQARSIRASTIKLLADDERVNPNTVRNRLKLLDLSPVVQEQLASGNLTADAALRFEGVDDGNAFEMLKSAADIEGLDLKTSQLPGDILITLPGFEKSVFAFDTASWFTDLPKVESQATKRIRAKTIDSVRENNPDVSASLPKAAKEGEVRKPSEIRSMLGKLEETIVDPRDPSCMLIKALRWVCGDIDYLPDERLIDDGISEFQTSS